jgi:restriction system protein
MAVWVVRGGRGNSYAQWCIEEGRAGAAWNNVPSLADTKTRDDVLAKYRSVNPEVSNPKAANFAGQLWGLRSIEPGDIVIMPLSGAGLLVVGRCTSSYEHLDESAPARHTVKVDWIRDDVPRSALGQDLLNSLGSLMTVFRIKRNGAESRFAQVIATGLDPDAGEHEEPTSVETPTDSSETPTDPDPVPTLETIRDRVRTYVRKHFREHELTRLVAEILEVREFVCDVSPPGKDQGVDILAGTGPLGLDSPTLIVEVKSEPGAVGASIVRGLQGAMLSHRADQGLLVAWGGITKDARAEIRKDRLTMRVWDADDVIDQIFDAYEYLSETLRAEIPLKRAWVLNESDGE